MTATTTTTPNVKQAVPFFMVTNIDDSLHFYVDGLGAVMTNRWIPEGRIEWCLLQLGDAALMLQEYRQRAAVAAAPQGLRREYPQFIADRHIEGDRGDEIDELAWALLLDCRKATVH